MSAPMHLRLFSGPGELTSGDNSEPVFATERHWLLVRNALIDLDTHAMTRLPGRSTVYSIDGGYLFGVGGSPVTRLHLTNLPDLHC
jgi:hypothetical protein